MVQQEEKKLIAQRKARELAARVRDSFYVAVAEIMASWK